MVHSFKLCGQRIVYDSVSGKAHCMSELAVKMIDLLTPPLRDTCPSQFRYSLAKYDSGDINSAYDEIYSLYVRGELFAEGEAKSAMPTDDGVRALIADYTDEANIKLALVEAEKDGFDSICPTHEVGADGEFAKTVLALREAGFTKASVKLTGEALNSPEKIIAEFDVLIRSLVRSGNTDFDFRPFNPDCIGRAYFGDASSCKGCFAYGICLGGQSGGVCDIIRKQTECALLYTMKKKG